MSACSMLLRGPAVRAAPPCRAQRARCAPARGAMHVRAAAGADGLADKLQLGALRPGAEVINGRAAMLGFLGVAVTELATGKTAWAQMGSGGLVTALLLMGAVSAASVAPVLTGAVAANKLYPSETDSYANERLPETWTPTAEVVNSRVAMAAFLFLLVEELVTGRAAL